MRSFRSWQISAWNGCIFVLALVQGFCLFFSFLQVFSHQLELTVGVRASHFFHRRKEDSGKPPAPSTRAAVPRCRGAVVPRRMRGRSWRRRTSRSSWPARGLGKMRVYVSFLFGLVLVKKIGGRFSWFLPGGFTWWFYLVVLPCG